MSFREQFPLLSSYTTGYNKYYNIRKLNCLYNKAIILAEQGIQQDNYDLIVEAMSICNAILNEMKTHIEARILLDYLCEI